MTYPNTSLSAITAGRHYLLATDGGCIPNPGPGGWGAIIQLKDGDTVLRQMPLAGYEPDSTNNRMELTAPIQSLARLKEPGIPAHILSDSQYLVNGMNDWLAGWKAKGWKGSGGAVKNRELWKELDRLSQLRPVTWHWVRGHDGHDLNEMADTLANHAAAKRYGRDGKKVRQLHSDWFI